jgi:hypothetical protein
MSSVDDPNPLVFDCPLDAGCAKPNKLRQVATAGSNIDPRFVGASRYRTTYPCTTFRPWDYGLFPVSHVINNQSMKARPLADVRTVKLRVTSPRKVPQLEIALSGPEKILSVGVDGRKLPAARGRWVLRFEVFPRSGSVELNVKTTPGRALELRIRETSYALAEVLKVPPRPSDMIRRPNTLDWFEGNHLSGDFMFVQRTFQIGPSEGR